MLFLLFTLLASVIAAPLETTVIKTSAIETREIEARGIDTRNDLIDGPCKAITVIFARGTTETGNIGLIVGPPLADALDQTLGSDNVAFQGVTYPASIAGYLVGGSPLGGVDIAGLINLAASKCPNTQIVLGGYSQGAQVVYLGAAQVASVANRIKAVVLFGNPNDGKPVPNIPAGECKTFCKTGDLICDGEPIVLPVHLTYGTDAPAAAQFIASQV